MLRELRIRDFAIIDELSLAFATGFNVLTGETGAGKSIIMQAVDLLCGQRGSPDAVRAKTDEAVIEGLFDLGAEERRALADAGFADADELLVRRVISRGGKSRVLLNGSLANVSILEQLGKRLIHVYGQLEHALLLRPDSHEELLDSYAGHAALRLTMAEHFAAVETARHELAAAQTAAAAAQQRLELSQFQLVELTDAALEAGEDERLRREREILAHAERLVEICQQGDEALSAGDDAVAGRLSRIGAQLRDAARIDPAFAELAEILGGAQAQVHEVAHRLSRYGEHINVEPGRRDAIEDRLALLTRIKRKYGGSLDTAIAMRETLGEEVARAAHSDERLAALRTAVAAADAAASATARELSARRRTAAHRLEASMAKELQALGMRGAGFQVTFGTPIDAGPGDSSAGQQAEGVRLTRSGADAVEFYLAANPGEPLKPLARIASGGELSRVMLALKVLTAGRGEVPTLIFDEVDTGIGGGVADAVGERLLALGATRQVLCITHLPQIAARAEHHFAVEKRRRQGRTVSVTRPLEGDERVSEIARMLGAGDEEAARYARRLMATRQREGRRGGTGAPSA